MSTQEYGRVPFIAESKLRKHKVYEPSDNRFRAAARLRQALYREERNWPIGHIEYPDGVRRKVGNYVKSTAATGLNLLTPEIAALARLEIAFREDMAMVNQNRLWQNLLSSHPLVLNLFGALKLDLDLATRVAKLLWPEFVDRVTAVIFEHSPGRRDPAFLDDRTAFDTVLECEHLDGTKAFVAIELKYSENLYEPTARIRPRYNQLSEQCGLFLDHNSPALRVAPLQSLWREHMLASSMLANHLYDRGQFVLVAPAANGPVQRAANIYRRHLTENGVVPFIAITLETVIDAIRMAGAEDIAELLFRRYADFSGLTQFI